MCEILPDWETYQKGIHWQNMTWPSYGSLHMRSSSDGCHQKLVCAARTVSIVQRGTQEMII